MSQDLGYRDAGLALFQDVDDLALGESGRMGISLAAESLPSNGLPGGEAYEPDEGLLVIDEALAGARATGDRLWEPELHRLKGELRLATAPADVGGALECFSQAIAIARQQQARSWELRAASSLARLLAAEGRRDEARRALADVYGWFTEGFDTADLREAKTLSEEVP